MSSWESDTWPVLASPMRLKSTTPHMMESLFFFSRKKAAKQALFLFFLQCFLLFAASHFGCFLWWAFFLFLFHERKRKENSMKSVVGVEREVVPIWQDINANLFFIKIV
jgi:hypothetical protein